MGICTHKFCRDDLNHTTGITSSEGNQELFLFSKIAMASSRSPAIAFLLRTFRVNDCHHVRPALKLNVYRELVVSVRAGFPIVRYFSCRARRRLVLRVPTWWSKLGLHFHHFLCLIIPEPHFPRLEAGRDGMAGSLKVLGSMLAGRAVTTADMPALSTTPQFDRACPTSLPTTGSLSIFRQTNSNLKEVGSHSAMTTRPGLVGCSTSS
jgi:hypothetical protein